MTAVVGSLYKIAALCDILRLGAKAPRYTGCVEALG